MSRIERALLIVSAGILVAFAAVRLVQSRPRPLDWAEPPPALLGQPAVPFALELTAGDTIQLPRWGRRTLVIAYRTDCPFCEASLRSWRRAFSASCEPDVVLVSAEPLELLQTHWDQLGFTGCADVVLGRAVDPDAFQSGYEVAGTPRHYLIGAAGEHERIWRGGVSGYRSERNFVAGLMP